MSKLDGYKRGDRVRVEVSGVVEGADDSGLAVYSDSKSVIVILNGSEVVNNLVSITRIGRAFTIDDEVIILGKDKGKVLGFLSNGNVAVEYQAGDTSWCGPYHPSCLTHA